MERRVAARRVNKFSGARSYGAVFLCRAALTRRPFALALRGPRRSAVCYLHVSAVICQSKLRRAVIAGTAARSAWGPTERSLRYATAPRRSRFSTAV